jgi:hypothetical protein
MNATPDDLNVVLRSIVDRAHADGYVVTVVARLDAAADALADIDDDDAIVVVLTKAKARQ